jgi:lysophospholipase L1-like esterase
MSGLRAKLEASDPIHVAYLGGSITQNTGGHTRMVSDMLVSLAKEQGSRSKFRFTNAGLSSTCSTSGAFRLPSHVLEKGPLDLLIVEFAVNDDQDAGHSHRDCVRGMEGIVRRTKQTHPDAEIVIVHFVNTGMVETLHKGGTPASIRAHEAVAEHYGIASVNVAASVAGSIKRGEYTWKDYGGVHPKPFGYLAASIRIFEAIRQGLAKAGKAAAATKQELPAAIDPQCYDAGVFVAPTKATRSAGWKTGKATAELMPTGAVRTQYADYDAIRAGKPGETLTLDFEGRAIGAFILAGPDAGIVETRIDGGDWKSTDLFHRFSEKLNYPRSVMFHTGLKRGRHRLELRVSETSHAKSRGAAATILYFEVNK